MRKIEMARKMFNSEITGEVEISYYITADETEEAGPIGLVEMYGVGISMGSEYSEVRSITSKSDRIENLAALLADNLVTPISLADVITDQLAAG